MTAERTVVVTGAEGDIGRALCGRLLDAGYRVEGIDRSARTGAAHRVTVADLTDPATVDATFAQFGERCGPLYGLVNCAGIYEALDATATTLDDFDRVWKGNVITAWLASMAFERHSADDGCIVNVASISGQYGSHDVAYGTAKAGVLGLTLSLALHLGPRLRVNAVAPGVVRGSMAGRIPDERLVKYRDRSILGRLGTPLEVAHAIESLLAPGASWITGSVLNINGGSA